MAVHVVAAHGTLEVRKGPSSRCKQKRPRNAKSQGRSHRMFGVSSPQNWGLALHGDATTLKDRLASRRWFLRCLHRLPAT